MQQERTHVLLVEDEEAHIELMLKAFRASPERFGTTVACNLADARVCIEEKTPDLLILDYNLPDGKGLELLKKHAEMPLFPIIILTGFGDEKLAVEVLKLGAMDYVVKSAGNLRDIPKIAKRTLREWSVIVKQKQSELALQKSEEKYSTLVEQGNDIILTVQDKIIKFANKRLTEIIGLSKEELIGRNGTDIIAEEYRGLVLERASKRLAGEDVPSIYEIEIVTADGKTIPVEMNVSIIDYEDRPAIMIIMRDIAKRKKAEDALKALTQTFVAHTGKELFNRVSGHLTKTLNIDYAFVGELLEEGDRVKVIGGSANGRPMESFEYDLADTPCANVMGQSSCAYPSGVQKLFPKDHLLVEMGIEGYFGSPLFDTHGKPVGIIVLLHTEPIENQEIVENLFKIFSERISAELERMKADKALRESEQRLGDIYETAPLAFVIWDRECRVTNWNRHAEKTFGWSAEEVIGHNFFEFLLPESAKPRVQDIVDSLLQGNLPSHSINETVTKDGRIIITEWNNAILRDIEGNITGAMSLGTDITERKKLQDQLIQSQKMESIGTLAGGIAHDFNNILNAIFGFTYLAKMKVPEGGDASDKLDSLMKAANRAADLVRQILLFSRRSAEELQPADITPVIREALKLLRASIPTTIEMRENIAATSHVLADPVQIHQILMNLCTNAYHAMQETGGILGVDLQEVNITPDFASEYVDLKPGPHIRLTVSDTGKGIDPSIVNRIFEPYFTTKEKGKGTGLGLSVVHGIVKSYGGEITLTSELLKGTSFQVYIPVIQKEETDAEKTDETLFRGTGRVLFVDDEKSTVLISTEILESLGYRVTGKTDSQEALSLFREKPDEFDVVITDMTMPKITGIKLAGEMIGIRPDIPVILCTGFSEGIDEETVKRKGIREFLMKPVAPVKIARAIHNILKEKRVRP